MFLKLEPNLISKNFNTLFKKVNIGLLLTKDSINTKYVLSGKHCMNDFYLSLQNKDTVVFTFNMIENPNYKPTKKELEEEGIDLSAECEHDEWWTFVLKKNKLKFINVLGAD